MIKLVSFICFFSTFTVFAQDKSNAVSSKNRLAMQDYEYGLQLFEHEQTDSALYYFDKALTLFDETKNGYYVAKTKNVIGLIYKQLAIYDKALENFYASRKYFERTNDTVLLIGSEINIGQFYNETGKYTAAKQLFKQVIKTLNSAIKITVSKRKELLAAAYNNYGISLQNSGDREHALVVYEQSLELKKQLRDFIGVSKTLNNIGSLYMETEENTKAKGYFFESLQIKRNIHSKAGIANSYLNIGEYYMHIKDYVKGEIYFDSCLRELEQLNIPSLQASAYYNLSIAQRKQGKDAQAFESLMQFGQLNQQLNTLASEKRIAVLRVLFDLEKKEQQLLISKSKISSLETEMNYKSIKLYSLIITAICLIFIVFYLFRNARLKDFNHKQQEKALLDKQHIKELENSRLRDELQLKNAELVSLTMQSLRKIETITRFEEELESAFNLGSKESLSAVEAKMQSFMKKMNASENDWDKFRFKLETTYPDFFNRLHQLNPDLTSTDIRHCAYMKIGLNTKEIGSLLNINPDSVQKSRVRLKKKLGLATETDMKTYIIQL